MYAMRGLRRESAASVNLETLSHMHTPIIHGKVPHHWKIRPITNPPPLQSTFQNTAWIRPVFSIVYVGRQLVNIPCVGWPVCLTGASQVDQITCRRAGDTMQCRLYIGYKPSCMYGDT